MSFFRTFFVVDPWKLPPDPFILTSKAEKVHRFSAFSAIRLTKEGLFGTIKEKSTTKGIGIQYFANRGIAKQNDKQLQKSIKSWQANVETHKGKINDPAKYDKEWESKDDRQKEGLVKHWKKEIRYSEANIKEAEAELAKRKEQRK